MESFGIHQNCQLLVALAQRVGALVISLLSYARHECHPFLEPFRKALLPMHRAVADFLGEPFAETSFLLRNPLPSFRVPSSMPHQFQPRESRHLVDHFPIGMSVTPPEDITPPGTPPRFEPLGYTSTPFPTPVVRPRPEPFALLMQVLTVMRKSDVDGIASVTGRFSSDPVFRERILGELSELRSIFDSQADYSAGGTIGALMDRVAQAEITLSSLINNLQHLPHH
ncbi:uncharacterized protein LOC128724809 [Anopheles nili]|uniref:uncharacterized protein LOC128724809 n=1 Tax=Anopheles nili TaxID=185578 RepID=UPI00237A4D4F|nr:uncharacterized protein LOC128724809 [Anopheles nili]